MNAVYKGWRNFFFICFGLFIGSAFCMKWMENDLRLNGELFSVIGLEITYSKDRIISIFSGLDNHVKTILSYHLYFDFIFMAGVYPGIAALCMMAREKRKSTGLKKVLMIAAIFQLIAYGCDITENLYLLNWLNDPVIGVEFLFYHIVVFAKWGLALAAAFIAIPLVLKKSDV